MDFLHYIRFAGGLFILYLAFQAARTWKKEKDPIGVAEISSGRTLMDATVVNFLNPGPWLGWSLVIGPLFLEGWNEAPFYGILLLSAFYLIMFLVTATMIVLIHQARERVPKLQRIMGGLSALILALFGFYQLMRGGSGILDAYR